MKLFAGLAFLAACSVAVVYGQDCSDLVTLEFGGKGRAAAGACVDTYMKDVLDAKQGIKFFERFQGKTVNQGCATDDGKLVHDGAETWCDVWVQKFESLDPNAFFSRQVESDKGLHTFQCTIQPDAEGKFPTSCSKEAVAAISDPFACGFYEVPLSDVRNEGVQFAGATKCRGDYGIVTSQTINGKEFTDNQFFPQPGGALEQALIGAAVLVTGAAAGGLYATKRRSSRAAAKSAESKSLEDAPATSDSAVLTDKPSLASSASPEDAETVRAKRKSTGGASRGSHGTKRKSTGGSGRKSGGSKRHGGGSKRASARASSTVSETEI